MRGLAICSKCVLPSSFPNITFDKDGICSQCSMGAPKHQDRFDRRQREEFERTVQMFRGTHGHDALACYSGGKDSTYMLKMMVRDLGLNVLAFTLDNGFITEQSKRNIIKIANILEVDHLFFKPSRDFMKRLYRQAIFGDLNKPRGNYRTRISDVCLACISVVNSQAAKLAIQNRIPMVFAGFTPGQIPRAVIKNHHRLYQQTHDQHKQHFQHLLGQDSERYLSVPEDEFEIFQMSPYLVYEKAESDILEEIHQLGWQHPENLDGCTSNCALNVVGNLCHEKKYGFHPYVLELSKLIRKGLLSRDQALQKLSSAVHDRIVGETLSQLGITAADVQGIVRNAA